MYTIELSLERMSIKRSELKGKIEQRGAGKVDAMIKFYYSFFFFFFLVFIWPFVQYWKNNPDNTRNNIQELNWYSVQKNTP